MMGQAKNRGTQEQRIRKAVEQKEAALEMSRQEKMQADIKRRVAESERRERGEPRVVVAGGSKHLSTLLLAALAMGMSAGVTLPVRKDKP
jgi:type II secretory pathway component PulF